MPKEVMLGEGSRIDGEKVSLGRNIKFGKGSTASGREISIEDNVTIGDNTQISAKSVFIGFGSRIESNCRIVLPGEESRFVLRDNCLIGNDSKIITPVFEAGDYLTLHNHALVNGMKPVKLGHNVWIGQNCILNSNDVLTIGNGVGIGAYSCVYTHGFFGELLEGCQVYKQAPVTIEDDAWIVGSYNIISPGVTVGKRTIILTGSVLTKDAPPFTCWAGSPAQNITEKVSTYREVDVDEKFEMMKNFIEGYVEKYDKGKKIHQAEGWRIETEGSVFEILFIPKVTDDFLEKHDVTQVVFTKKNAATGHWAHVTVFDLSTKLYTKRRTTLEVDLIKFLSSTKARFLPI
jgi:acetyltransferase-like isoleucine patch superfamily enzyme